MREKPKVGQEVWHHYRGWRGETNTFTKLFVQKVGTKYFYCDIEQGRVPIWWTDQSLEDWLDGKGPIYSTEQEARDAVDEQQIWKALDDMFQFNRKMNIRPTLDQLRRIDAILKESK